MPVVVGSVVGAVAGSALMLVILLYLFRYWKRKQGYEHHGGGRLASSDGPSTMVTTITGPGAHSRPKSIIYAVPAALASLTGYKGRSPPPDDPPADEKGFYRVSGRKLPSVLTSGGDGYGDETSSKASFYRDSTGRTAIAMRESGVPMMRPSPARTPVTERGPLELPAPGMLSDGIGRSHASQDGSRATKFAEEV